MVINSKKIGGIELETRRITENYDDMFVTVDEKYIKDLIKADLVEKKGD